MRHQDAVRIADLAMNTMVQAEVGGGGGDVVRLEHIDSDANADASLLALQLPP